MQNNNLQQEKLKIDQELDQIRQRNAKKKPSRLWLLAVVFVLLILIAQAFILAQVYLPITIFKYTTSSFQVLNSPLHPGDRLVYKVSYCKYIDSGSTVTFQVTGPTVFQAQAITSNLPVGCATINASNVSLPKNMLPGTYHVDMTNTFIVNGFRTEAFRNHTTDFVVLP